jgi:DNA-binding XRE family transcriptional regulator
MPFKEWDIESEIAERMEHEKGFKESYEQVNKEYDLIKQAIQLRKEQGLTQSDIAQEAEMTQQVVSRMEKLGHSPTLRNFIKYIDALGLDIKIVKRM